MEQLKYVDSRLSALQEELTAHSKDSPPRGTKSFILHTYKDKCNFLQFEVLTLLPLFIIIYLYYHSCWMLNPSNKRDTGILAIALLTHQKGYLSSSSDLNLVFLLCMGKRVSVHAYLDDSE